MASRSTYLLICDRCGDVYVPRVRFATDAKQTADAEVFKNLGDVRAEARNVGWTAAYSLSTYQVGGRAYATDQCPACVRVSGDLPAQPESR